MRLATWNVRTMSPGLSEPQEVNDARKTAIIDRELSRLNVDVACLQETRLAENGQIKEANFTFFWQGKPADEPRRNGVGFAVKNSLIPCIEPTSIGSDRIITLRIGTPAGRATIINPTRCP